MSLKLTFIALAVLFGLLTNASKVKHNFGCNAILNDQIKREFEASHTYLSLGNHFAHDSQALHGFSKMFYKSWKEELSHGEHIIDYVIKRGGVPCTPTVSRHENDTKWSSMNACEVINTAIKLEKSVTDSLLKVHECARGEGVGTDLRLCASKDRECSCQGPTDKISLEDPHLQDFLEGEFLTEQFDGLKELGDLYTRMIRVGCDGLGLHMINDELLSKHA